MFKKKKCPRCNSGIKTSFDFCPSCGKSLKKKENWGMLGKNDFIQEDPFSNLFGNLNGGMLGKMLNGTMKMLEKEMQKIPRENIQETTKSSVELFINGKRINPKNIKVSHKPQQQKIESKIAQKLFSPEKKKKFSELKKIEPETNLKRLSDKIIYEVQIPGVKSIEDISINQLENSIEIKAIAKEKAYSKIIQISLPILDYFLEKNKLILELGETN